ncbi:MAG: hypothetical protein ACF8GE_04360 [Phycisphaerales bacterium JB043]
MITSPDPSRPPVDASPAATPLLPILTITALNSFSTGAISYSIFFVAKLQYAFDEVRNLALGLMMGFMYVVGALAIGPVLRRASRRSNAMGTRGVFLMLMVLLSGVIALPSMVASELVLWVASAVYMPLVGGVWPITESYISGGRTGRALRHATSAFNVTWAPAVMVSMWMVAPLLDIRPLAVFGVIALVHALCVPAVLKLPREPAHHMVETPEPHPAVYESLLIVFRWMLVCAYLIGAVISPLLPDRFATLDVHPSYALALTSTWTLTRIVMFATMGVWHFWHGKWRTVIWTFGTLLGGFGLALLAPSATLLVVGLAIMGVGMGGIYTAALYYAMSVGASEVEAGGKHEAAIGLGFTLGPLAGLGGYWVAGELPETLSANQWTLTLTVALIVLMMLGATRNAIRIRT